MCTRTGVGSYEERYAKMLALQVRFEAKTREGDVPPGMATPCRVWTAATYPDGYGQFQVGGRAHVAHRVAYALRHGVWSTRKLCLDHVCRNRACVNPDHLELVAASENVYRGKLGLLRELRTHCRMGHALTPENRGAPERAKSGRVYPGKCRTCRNAGMRTRHAAKKDKEKV